MRDYIGNFFSCTDCAQHFTSMSKNLEDELKYPNSSVLWLWRAHNRVNKRLKGDLTEDPAHPKSQYPYPKDCPQCYLSNGNFSEDEVWKYLIDRYGHVQDREEKPNNFVADVQPMSRPENENQPQTNKLIYPFKDNKDQFSFTDYSLIVGLYVLIAGIVLSVFFYLPMKIRRKAKLPSKSTASSRYLDV